MKYWIFIAILLVLVATSCTINIHGHGMMLQQDYNTNHTPQSQSVYNDVND